MSDLQRYVKRHKLALVLTAVIGAVAAFTYTAIVKAEYQGTASLQFEDITTLEGLVGTPAATLELPAELAAGSARTVTSDAVLAQARAQLGTKATIKQLRSAVSATVDTASNLVLVTATSHDARLAAAIANAAATAAANATNATSRLVFKAEAGQLNAQIATIPRTAANLTTIQNEQVNLSHLQTLSVVARPAEVVQQADVPTSPLSPKPLFDTLLGAVLGLIVGGGIIFMREGLDNTVRSQDEIEELLDISMVVAIEEAVLGTAPLVEGNDRPELRQVPATFGVLRRGLELLNLERPPRLIAVTSAGPEEGKTTVALALACAFAAVGRRTLLLDCDLRRPGLAGRLGVPQSPGLIDQLLHDLPRAEVLREVAIVSRIPVSSNGSRSKPVLECILAGAPVNDADELLSSNTFRELLGQLADSYDVVVIDTPPLLPVPDALEILPLVDARVVCVRAHKSRIADIKALRAVLDRLPATPSLGISTGWTRQEMKDGAGYYGDYYGQPGTVTEPVGL